MSRAILLLALLGCLDHGGTSSLLPANAQVDPDVRRGCALAEKKCATCHPLERVALGRGGGASGWAAYIEEMRLKPASGISQADAQLIHRCLVYLEPPPRRTRR